MAQAIKSRGLQGNGNPRILRGWKRKQFSRLSGLEHRYSWTLQESEAEAHKNQESFQFCLKLAIKPLGPDFSTLGLNFLLCKVVAVVNYRIFYLSAHP